MLTCVCRPVSGNLPKMPPHIMPPAQRAQRHLIATHQAAVAASASASASAAFSAPFSASSSAATAASGKPPLSSFNALPSTVVTAEPKINVPGRLTSAELRAMALRQQQQIDSQHQLLATKEQRLRFLKTQEVRNAVANAEGERLRRLRERVEAQESKLRRLRALRGQVDLQKTYNVTLSNDLDSIRALFSEKEKELSLAVAKVEALTRQLEDLRRDRRCPINLIGSGNGAAQSLPPQATRELEKLRRELMYRNQLSLQQDARLHLQREALQQRQAELRSVDQRIYELQTRLQRKKAANIQVVAQNQSHQLQQQHHHQQQQQQQTQSAAYNAAAAEANAFQTNLAKQGVAALKQQLLQKQAAHLSAHHGQQLQQQSTQLQQQSTQLQQQQSIASKFSNIIGREPSRGIARGNVAAVEPYIHTPQKSTITPTAGYLGGIGAGGVGGVGPGGNGILKHAAATANTNQQNQLILTDLTHVKLNLAHAQQQSSHHSGSATAAATATTAGFFSGESDESKLAKKLLTAKAAEQAAAAAAAKQAEVDGATHIYAEVGPKKRDLQRDALPPPTTVTIEAQAQASSHSTGTASGSKIPKSIGVTATATSAAAMISKLNSAVAQQQQQQQLSPPPQPPTLQAKTEAEKKHEVAATSETLASKSAQQQQQQQQLTVHSMPLGAANKSVALAVANVAAAASSVSPDSAVLARPKPLHSTTTSAGAGSLTVPPRKPISSVAPTSVSSSAIPKMITYSPKVNRVAPNVIASATSAIPAPIAAQPDRPALPPKPSKISPTEVATAAETAPTTNSSSGGGGAGRKSLTDAQSTLGLQTVNDNLPIKAKPLTIRKQPMSEQPRLKSSTSIAKSSTVSSSASSSSSSASSASSSASSASAAAAATATQQSSSRNTAFVLYAEVNKVGRGEAPHGVPPAVAATTTAADQTAASNSPTASSSSADELDHQAAVRAPSPPEKTSPESLKRRMRTATNAAGGSSGAGGGGGGGGGSGSGSGGGGGGKPKLARRVSFDPLALLLDASLEGELELVRKTAMQVANPSAANDEGITALHNAICAGHIDIVKFLVQFGCDVNAQDSDGWTPLHCAASCNNLSMVKFLVESGACLFASTLSDHETPAEKCEEDEEGFDGCSEYLYSIQEKLGILHSGAVYAVFSYEAQNSDELTFSVNDSLTILRKGDDAESEWWWAKNHNDDEGYVPRNLLGLYPRVPPQTSNCND